MPRNFEFRVIVCPHRKQLLLELVRLEAFITLTDFQFKFLPIDKYTVLVLALREKMRQNEKALLLALISFLSFNRLCPKQALEHIIVQSSPGTHYFYSFLCEMMPQTSKCLRTPLFFITFPGPVPRTTLYLAETAPDPTMFYFSRYKFCPRLPRTCPGPAPDLVWGIVTLLL